MFMEEKKFQKLINTVKNKLKRNHKNDSFMNEYIFNSSDLDELKKNNKEKIKELKKDIQEQEKKKKILNEEDLNESILYEKKKDITPISIIKEEPLEEYEETIIVKDTNSFINLSKEYQELIMKEWSEINFTEVDKDIIEGKEILNHNYTIKYADDAQNFITKIREKYEIVLCYLIGFNNEKKGIYEKTIFSDKEENEWKYLNYYIKILEKIRNFKLH